MVQANSFATIERFTKLKWLVPSGVCSDLRPTKRACLSAVTGTLQHPKIDAPGSDCLTILVSHHPRNLM